MPRKTDEWIARIKDVEREHGVTKLAMRRLQSDAIHDASIIEELGSRDLRNASDRLDGTYIIRLFAEFETGLRGFWATRKKTTPPAEVLINRIGQLRDIPDPLVLPVHEIREYRNALIHEREGDIIEIPLAIARGHLCRYFARLPSSWA